LLRHRLIALAVAIAAGTAVMAGSAGLGSAGTHPRTLLVQHGAKRFVPFTVKMLHSSKAQTQYAGTSMTEGVAFPSRLATGQAASVQPYSCEWTINQSLNTVVSTATAWLHTCVNVDYCVQVAHLQWKDPGGTFVNIGEPGGQTHGCSPAQQQVGRARQLSAGK
jgi:hypothetical protein